MDCTAELLKKGWTLRRSHQNLATHITMDATAEIRQNPCSIINASGEKVARREDV